MTKELKTTVKVDRLFLATDNPRHDEVDDEGEAIGLLCRSENIEELARDIVKYGSNPAERLIVFPVDPAVDVAQLSDKTTFIVAEGNRRVCALKLLHDPDLAPPRVRDTFRKLGPVDVHRRRIMVAARAMKAEKLLSVLQHLVAIPLNSLSFPKKFSIRCRHL